MQDFQGSFKVIFYVVVCALIFYLFILQPRKKQDKKYSELLDNLQRGDRVVTIGGMKGEVSEVKDDSVLLKVDDNVEIEFLKKAIAGKNEDK